jgi:hypothetical protein
MIKASVTIEITGRGCVGLKGRPKPKADHHADKASGIGSR